MGTKIQCVLYLKIKSFYHYQINDQVGDNKNGWNHMLAIL